MERDRYLSPMEAQDFGLIDRVLVHPPQAGQDEPELVQKEPAAASPAAQPESPAADQSPMGTNSPSSYKPEPWTQLHKPELGEEEHFSSFFTSTSGTNRQKIFPYLNV